MGFIWNHSSKSRIDSIEIQDEVLKKVLVNFINHIVSSDALAEALLKKHSGKVFHVHFPLDTDLFFFINEKGLIEHSSFFCEPNLILSIRQSALFSFFKKDIANIMQHIDIEGDADFAQTIWYLVKNLKWNVEQDLSKFFCNIIIQKMINLAKNRKYNIERFIFDSSVSISEYLIHEKNTLAIKDQFNIFKDDVRTLNDDLDRLEKRLRQFIL